MSSVAELTSKAELQLGNGSVADGFSTLKAALPLAILQGDTANTILIAEAMQGLIAVYGNTEQQSGQNRTKIEWDGEPLDKLIQRAKIKQANSAGFAMQEITWKSHLDG